MLSFRLSVNSVSVRVRVFVCAGVFAHVCVMVLRGCKKNLTVKGKQPISSDARNVPVAIAYLESQASDIISKSHLARHRGYIVSTGA
jgi:hypothetical protein